MSAGERGRAIYIWALVAVVALVLASLQASNLIPASLQRIFDTPSKISDDTTHDMASGKPGAVPNFGLADAIAHRHSVYSLNSTLPAALTDETVVQLVRDAVLNVPSAFNSQTTRLVLLAKGENKRFWEGVADVFRNSMDAEAFGKQAGRFQGFANAYGTILFYEDRATIEKSQARSPQYAHLFPDWAEHTSGMHQFSLWTSLEAFEGVGANLQHYHSNPEVTKLAQSMLGVPPEWLPKAQLVFGGTDPAAYPGAKDKLPTSETVKVFGL